MARQEKMEETKRRLIRSLEEARKEQTADVERRTPAAFDEGEARNITGDDREVERLKKELLASRKTCKMLQKELERLEGRAVRAIAEAAECRCRLQEQGSDPGAGDTAVLLRERERLTAELRRISTDKRLLLDALCASEREIGRLTRALELLASRLRVA